MIRINFRHCGFVMMVTLLSYLIVPFSASSADIISAATVVAEANPPTSDGSCPGQLKFTGTIEVSRQPMAGNYHWERSLDGAKWQKQKTEAFKIGKSDPAGYIVLDYLNINVGEQKGKFVERLVVNSGNTHVTSAPVTFNCSANAVPTEVVADDSFANSMWGVVGQSKDGVKWKGTLGIKAKGTNRYECVFKWTSDAGHKGTEKGDAIFNPKNRQLRINAKALDGNVSGGKYLVTLSEDSKSLEKGRWSESGDGGGNWSAKKWDKKQ